MTNQSIYEASKFVWEDFYSDGNKALEYPDENLIRLFSGGSNIFLPKASSRLLDHGFGSANNSLYFARLGYEVFGAEISESAINFAYDFFKSKGEKGDFRHIKGTELPFDNNMFDIVVSWNCIHYNGTYEDVKKTLDNIYKVLKPGGVILLSTISTSHTLCLGANQISRGHFQVKPEHRFDKRGGLQLFVPLSKEHFLEVYSGSFTNISYGSIDVNLFVSDKAMSCHLMYGKKPD